MAEYQFVDVVDPASKIPRVQYAKGKYLELKGEPQALTDAQVEKLSKYVVLNKIEDGAGVVAEFGPAPEDSAKDEEKSEKSAGGAGGTRGKG